MQQYFSFILTNDSSEPVDFNVFEKKESFSKGVNISGVGFTNKDDKCLKTYQQTLMEIFDKEDTAYIVKEVHKTLIYGEIGKFHLCHSTIFTPGIGNTVALFSLSPIQFQTGVIREKIIFPLFEGVVFKTILHGHSKIKFDFFIHEKVTGNVLEKAAAYAKNQAQEELDNNAQLIRIEQKLDTLLKRVPLL